MTVEEYKCSVEKQAIAQIGEEEFRKVITRFNDYPQIVEWMYGNEKNKEKPNVKHAVEDLLYWFPADKK